MAKMYLKHLQQKNNERGVRLLKNYVMLGIGLMIMWFL